MMQDPANFLGPPPGVMIESLITLGVIAAIPIYFIVRFLRAYERRTRIGDVGIKQDQELDSMRDTIERLEREVQRLSEAQQFTTQLLAKETVRESRDVAPPT